MAKFRMLALVPAFAALAACHRGPKAGGAPPAAPVRTASESARSIATATAGYVEAPSLAKSPPALRLKFAPQSRPTVGVPLTIDLAMIPPEAALAATINVAADPSFNVDPASRTITLPSLLPHTLYRRRITVTPTAAGVQALAIDVALSRASGIDQADFVLPLIVATAATQNP